MLLNFGVGEDSWESLGLQGDPTSPFWRRSGLGFLWREWCWSWNSRILATSCEELTHWKRPWCWEGLGAGGEGDDRGWDGWMASLTQWTWVWVNSGNWWWTGRPGVLRFMGSQRVRRDWVTELNCTELIGRVIRIRSFSGLSENQKTNVLFWNVKRKLKSQKSVFPGGSDGKGCICSARDPGSNPGMGRPFGEGNGNHASILAWIIPWKEEPSGLQSMGSQKVRHYGGTKTL